MRERTDALVRNTIPAAGLPKILRIEDTSDESSDSECELDGISLDEGASESETK